MQNDSIRRVPFRKTTPRLPVASLQRTIGFYTNILGFNVSCLWPEGEPSFCLLERDGVRLAFDAATPEQMPAKTYACGFYIEVDGVSDMHEGIREMATVEWGPEVYDYGCREFAIRDPDGYLIIFTEETSEAPSCRVETN